MKDNKKAFSDDRLPMTTEDTPQAPPLPKMESVRPLMPLEMADMEFPLPVEHEKFGPYQLLNTLGAGGCGVVFRAEHIESGNIVALKLIKQGLLANKQVARRFEKEVRLHQTIDSAYIPRQIGSGVVGGFRYLACELVEGIDLQKSLADVGKFPERLSLLIVADILKGLGSLHEASMVHRDVKPGNVIVDFGPGGIPSEDNFRIAKLVDLGLARQIEQTRSLEITQQVCLGTPLFQPPEQFVGSQNVTAAADVYSVGLTLYCLLSGKPPFQSDAILELAEMHRSSVPSHLSDIDDQISGAVSSVVARAIEKNPGMRYQNATEMLRDVQQILGNAPIAITTLAPASHLDNANVKTFVFERDMSCSAENLWPLVADTDRFNRAIGLPTPEYTFVREGQERKRMAVARFKGMRMQWHERPFEWLEGRETSILREFETGPFCWVKSHVKLSPVNSERTHLTHRIDVQPRGFIGKMLTPIQFGLVTSKAIDRAYERMESIARTDSMIAGDQNFSVRTDSHLQVGGWNSRLKALPAAGRSLSPDQLDLLRQYVNEASDPAVSRMRPKTMAYKLGCNEREFLKFALHSSRVGLLTMMWDVICPVCRIASNSCGKVADIESHQYCEACDLTFEVDFADAVELIFRVHPELRRTQTKTFCVGGPYHAPHVAAQLTVGANQNAHIQLNLQQEGYLLVRGPGMPAVQHIAIADDSPDSRVELDLFDTTSQHQIKTGEACLCLKNTSADSVLVRVERSADRSLVTTAGEVYSVSDFSELFPDQAVDARQLTTVTKCYGVGVRFFGVDQVARAEGEVAARNRVQEHIKPAKTFAKESVNHGDDYILIFDELTQAMESCEMLIRMWDGSGEVVSGLVIACGESFVAYQDGNRNIFGPTIRSLSDGLRNAQPRKIAASESVRSHSDWSGQWEAFL